MLGTLGPKGQVVIDFFQAIFEVIMKMVTGVMWMTPVGVSSVIAGKILGVSNVGKYKVDCFARISHLNKG